jgi:predicted RNA methylase
MSTFKVQDRVRDVLAAATIDASSVKLNGQLDRDLYVEVNKVLAAAGGKWNRKAGAHVFSRDPRESLGLAVETGRATNVKKALQAFYTPAPLAARMAALADLRPDHLVLEPSAGMGALADAVVAAGVHRANVRCWEIDELAAATLRGHGYRVVLDDFLAATPDPTFDRVVMNPPFTKGQDVRHVTHALQFLRPGGRLVALTAPGWRFQETRAAVAFRDLLDGLGAEVEEVPAGTFRESGTGIATVLVTIDRDAAREVAA